MVCNCPFKINVRRLTFEQRGGKDHNRVYVAAGGYTVQSAVEETEARDGVVVAFGRHFPCECKWMGTWFFNLN